MSLRLIPVLAVLACAGALSAQPPAEPGIEVSVFDSKHQPVPGVRLELKIGEVTAGTAETDVAGQAAFRRLRPERYLISASKDGLEPVTREVDISSGVSAAIEITAVPALVHKESIEVKGTIAPVEQGATAPSQLNGQIAKEMPNRPATVADALPLISGVVREPGGGLIISASPEHRNALIVNSADVTDPATGQFGLTVPIDSVEVLNVYQTAYLAEYGRFSSGLVSVETKRGGEKWKWELNDPLPEFFIRSWHMRGLKNATPRLNFEGPILARKLFISEGSEYETRKTPVLRCRFPITGSGRRASIRSRRSTGWRRKSNW